MVSVAAVAVVLSVCTMGCGTGDQTKQSNRTRDQHSQSASSPTEEGEAVGKAASDDRLNLPEGKADTDNIRDEITGTVGVFRTEDLAGESVTESIFAEKDLTMLNIWGTYCGPCIAEMPELGDLAEKLPENVQIVGLVCDVTPGNDTSQAQEIVDSTGADYLHILYNYDMSGFMQGVYAVPTTLFIDRDGNILGEPVVGADLQSYRARLQGYLGT